MNSRLRTLLIIAFAVLILGATMYTTRGMLRDWWRALNTEPVPDAVTFEEIGQADFTDDIDVADENIDDSAKDNKNEDAVDDETSEVETPVNIPETLNLDIPFTSQAPLANWDLPYQEACEEASMLMAARFLQGRTITGPDDADSAILELVDFADVELGYPIDMTAEETANAIEEFYNLRTEVLYDFTWDDIKTALTQGYPVIVPAAGRELGNPNFTSPGPIYHMLVIKGYTENRVITNDPGTRNGADYSYDYDVLYNAMHDWNGGNVNEGKKVIIIVKP